LIYHKRNCLSGVDIAPIKRKLKTVTDFVEEAEKQQKLEDEEFLETQEWLDYQRIQDSYCGNAGG